MLPWQTIAEAEAPDGQRMVLSRRGQEFLIRVGGWDLMSSRDDTTARALASVGCEVLGAHRRALGMGAPGRPLRVLIGGLGMGFSVAAAIDALTAQPELAAQGFEIEVAELTSAVVTWNEGPLAALAGAPLRDPRVRVHVGDVAEHIAAAAPGTWDAILLDVDNGPDPLAHDQNAGLYGGKGLAQAHRALAVGGVHGVWSYSDEGTFSQALRRAGFSASVHRVANRGRDRGRTHAIWVGCRDSKRQGTTRRSPKAKSKRRS